MLDPRFVRENIELVTRKLAERGMEFDFAEFLHLEGERRRLLSEGERLKHQRNLFSERVAERKRRGEKPGAEVTQMREVSAWIKKLDEEIKSHEERLRGILLTVPNIPHPSVPLGSSASDNVEIRCWGNPPQFNFSPKPHWEAGEALGILDFERAARIAGARFAVLVGAGALLERALINFMLDLHTKEHGYREVLTPFLVNAESMLGTGQLPKFEDELFKTADDGLYLIPTAEVPVTNLHREEILEAGTLPLSYVAYSPCFRKEAGSYGKDVRGLVRQHQFNKVELMKFVEPESSYDDLEKLTAHAEEVLRRLGLHYRVVVLCTGDLGFSAAKTYDLEVWLPSQGLYREISSCSNFEDFQARRARIKYRPAPKAKPEYVHTLNGSGLAVGRTLMAILECYQEADGSVIIPEALRPYMGGMERITKA
ncbi:MAG: serine--tRNA ligase [candidate division NC10 bacterium]|nr:serine--tRNA ligase [candidate division NC10 bacterium]